MSLLVYITGKLGAGKSKATENWAAHAPLRIVPIDDILRIGGRNFNPHFEDPWNWDFWKTIHRESQQATHLQHALAANHADLREHIGNLVVEGSILCNDWFRDAFEDVLLKWIPGTERTIHHFYLNPPDEVILDNIRRRGRPKELKRFQTVDDVRREHQGFDEVITRSKNPWKENTHTSSASLVAALRGFS